MDSSERVLAKSSEVQIETAPVAPAVRTKMVQRALFYAVQVGHFARLLFELMMDARVDRKVKFFAGAVLAYIISPVDFIPEIFTGIFGYADDFVLSAFALNIILNWVDPEIVKEHWRGQGDLLATVQKVMQNAELLVPEGILKKIQLWIGKRAPKSVTQ